MEEMLWKRWMTEEDYGLVTKGMTEKGKKRFNEGFTDPNQIMSLGAYGLIKTLSPEKRRERRKDIPEFLEKIKYW